MEHTCILPHTGGKNQRNQETSSDFEKYAAAGSGLTAASVFAEVEFRV
jgi:hypothetical protein